MPGFREMRLLPISRRHISASFSYALPPRCAIRGRCGKLAECWDANTGLRPPCPNIQPIYQVGLSPSRPCARKPTSPKRFCTMRTRRTWPPKFGGCAICRPRVGTSLEARPVQERATRPRRSRSRACRNGCGCWNARCSACAKKTRCSTDDWRNARENLDGAGTRLVHRSSSSASASGSSSVGDHLVTIPSSFPLARRRRGCLVHIAGASPELLPWGA